MAFFFWAETVTYAGDQAVRKHIFGGGMDINKFERIERVVAEMGGKGLQPAVAACRLAVDNCREREAEISALEEKSAAIPGQAFELAEKGEDTSKLAASLSVLRSRLDICKMALKGSIARRDSLYNELERGYEKWAGELKNQLQEELKKAIMGNLVEGAEDLMRRVDAANGKVGEFLDRARRLGVESLADFPDIEGLVAIFTLVRNVLAAKMGLNMAEYRADTSIESRRIFNELVSLGNMDVRRLKPVEFALCLGTARYLQMGREGRAPLNLDNYR